MSPILSILAIGASINAAAATPVSCPYTSKELKETFGIEFKDGQVGFESDFGTGKSLSCRYQSQDMTLMVKQTVMKNPSQTQGWDSALAGKKMKLPNDSDNAQVQTDQGDNTNPNLHYARQGDIVEIRMMGIGKTNPAFEAIQKKITNLRRLP
nr:hypothetical protein [uncultured Undibacterium sp.]